MKLIIVSSHCVKTDLIEYQYKSIKKFVNDADYEYIIFNDATNEGNFCNHQDPHIKEKIHDTCNKYNIKCIDIPQELQQNRTLIFPNTSENVMNSCTRCAVATQYMFNYFKNTNEDIMFMILDSDMFFINYININDYMRNKKIAFLENSRNNDTKVLKYMWNGIIIMKLKQIENKELINFDCGKIDGISVDVGGNTHKFVELLSEQDIMPIGWTYLRDLSCVISTNYTENVVTMLNNVYQFYDNEQINGETFLNNCIYHIRGFGGNWDYGNKYFRNFMMREQNESNPAICWKKYCIAFSEIFRKYTNSI